MEGEPVWLQILSAFLAFIICPIVGVWVVTSIRNQLKDMKNFEHDMFGETREIKEKDITKDCKLLE